MRYFLTLSNGTRGVGVTPDGTFPPGSVECTYAQYQASNDYTIDNGQIVPYAPPAPTLAEQAAAALAAGLIITSISTPALNGTYSIDESAQARINRVAVYLQINGTFPGSTNTITWLDISGGKHSFDAAQFKALATAIGDYVAGLDDVILGLSDVMPSNSAHIA